jgi:hypothetical protein
MIEVTTSQDTAGDCPGEYETPGGTVSLFAYPDGRTLVVTGADYTSADWQAVCAELARRGYGPYALSDGPVAEGDCDTWTATMRLPAAV